MMKKREEIVKSQDNLLDFSKKIEENDENIEKYVIKHTKNVYFKGEIIDTYVEVNPIIITNKFFKPILPLYDKFNYNTEQLCLLYEYYNNLLLEINDRIGPFPSSLTLFCRFIGMTLQDFKDLRENGDDMRLVVQKIIDDVDDANLSMAQTGGAKERTTLFRLKTQNEMVEKTTPNVSVNIKANLDDNRIKGNILDYQEFLGKSNSGKKE